MFSSEFKEKLGSNGKQKIRTATKKNTRRVEQTSYHLHYNLKDVPAEGHTGGRSHMTSPPYFCGACLNFTHRTDQITYRSLRSRSVADHGDLCGTGDL